MSLEVEEAVDLLRAGGLSEVQYLIVELEILFLGPLEEVSRLPLF